MHDRTDNGLKKIVNLSGFPLQIGLKNVIEQTSLGHGWRVLSEEHPWMHNEANKEGFIDLILADNVNTFRMIIECKRVRDTEWIFLNPSTDIRSTRHARFWHSLIDEQGSHVKVFDWTDIDIYPPTPEAMFCVIPGQDSKSPPMLERVAGDLVNAVEIFAAEELSRGKYDNSDFKRFYIPTIVTTAELKICKFDPANISIKDGEIPNDAEFETVPFIRFRKSLSTKVAAMPTLGRSIATRERTILIINSSHLTQMLIELNKN